ncbi:MAG: phosphate signaling complex protein PhoU [Chloroflexota bacterium]
MPTRKTFEHEIQELKDEIIIMGSMVEQAMLDSVDALKKRDRDWSRKIIKQDEAINDKRFDLESRVMIVIATQQPMARDLRVIASVLEVISELERMGDYAKGIGVINVRMADQPLLKPLIDIPLMAQLGTGMLHRALSSFVNEDVEAAKIIPTEDDKVDELYNQVYRELMSYVISDATSIERANWLLWAAHNLERFADRVTNICERTIFVETGEYMETKSGPV